MRHLGPTRPDRILYKKLHTMFRWHVVPFQHISETMASSRSISEWTCRPGRLFVYRGNRPPTLRLSLSIWNCCRMLFLSLLHFPSALHPFFCHCSIIFSMEGTGRKRPRYSCPDLKDDVVEEIIDRCDVITSASMAGSFKTILDSTNNIITRNPRVQERFDLPYLLRHDVGRRCGDNGSLALCASWCRLIMIRMMLRCHRLRARLGQAQMEIGLFTLVQLRVGTCECVHSWPGSTSKNVSRLPRGWAHWYCTHVQIRSWWLSSMEDSNLLSSQPLLELQQLWSCCYLRQACCRPWWFDSMDIAQKSVSVHEWVLWCNSIRGSCVCCHHSWHCFCMGSS